MADNVVGDINPNWFMSKIEAACDTGDYAQIQHTIADVIRTSSEIRETIRRELEKSPPRIGPRLSYRIANAISQAIMARKLDEVQN